MNSTNISNINNICPICFKQISESIAPYNDIGWTDFGIFDNLQVMHCISCGFGFSMPELNKKVVDYFYEKQYRAKDSTFHIDFSKLKYYDGIRDIRNSRPFGQLSLARAFCKFNSQDIFLDVGPGLGGSFKVAKVLFENPKLYAIELSQGASEFYRNSYNVLCHPSIDDFISSEKKAQIILMSHSLEHYRLSDLPKLFSNLALALDKNGVVVAEVPNVDLRLHCENRGADTPHFLFFSKESLALIFEKYSFEVLFIDTCGPDYPSVEEFLISHSNSSKIKSHLKQTFNNQPKFFQIVLRTILRAFRKTKNFKLTGKLKARKTLPNQSYGGNRNCIRIVVRKK